MERPKMAFFAFSHFLIFIFHENSTILRISVGKVCEVGAKLKIFSYFMPFFMLKFDRKVKIYQNATDRTY